MAKAVKKSASWTWWLIGLVLSVILGAVGRGTEAIAALKYGVGPPPILRIGLDGSAMLTNSSPTAPSEINGYEIGSTAGLLDPSGWRSIADAAGADPDGVGGQLGASALSFTEVAADMYLISEVSASGYATFQPGELWDIGRPVLPAPIAGDLTFYYMEPACPGEKSWGIVQIVPEPGTLALVGAGALVLGAWAWRGQRRTRSDQD